MAFSKVEWSEDTFKGATVGCSVFIGLYNTVAADAGNEKASDMLVELGAAMGTQHGEMLKGQLGDQKLDVQKLSDMIVGLDSAFGARVEVEQEADSFNLRIHECPLAAAYQALGIDHETGKKICEDWGVGLFQNLMNAVAPNGKYELVHYRETWDGVCEERYSPGE